MTAKIRIGTDFWAQSRSHQDVPVIWDETALSNPHVGVAGTTGAGKTHWIKRFCMAMPDDVEIDIFDTHGDLGTPGEVDVLFSEATRYGYNPLVLNPDVHFGGVRRCVADFIEATSATSHKLGEIQAGVLRNLLTDAYAARGISATNPATWVRKEITESQAKALMENRDWNAIRECYPHLSDVLSLAKRKLKALWLGVEDQGQGRAVMSAFDECSRAMSALRSAQKKINLAGSYDDVSPMMKRVENSKAKAIEAFSAYVTGLETGREFEEAIKYNSKDVLISLITRLENLIAKGVFNPNPPPFGGARKRRYNLTPMAHSIDELRMFVNYRLKSIIREMKELGESKRIRRVIVIDECKNYLDEDPQAPINVISTEMRKFGVMLILSGQSPTHWSQDFIKSAGTLLLLNLATVDWNDAARKLKIDVADLKYLRPQQTGAIRMLEKNRTPSFRRVEFDQARRA